MNDEAIIIDTMSPDTYHAICGVNLAKLRLIVVSIPTVVNLGTVICCALDTESVDLGGIASLLEVRIDLGLWHTERGQGARLEDHWTRFKSADVWNRTVMLSPLLWSRTLEAWLSQANYIFTRVGTTSIFEDYVLMSQVDFCLEISGTADEPPIGFLFVCPPKWFQTGPSSFRWPECPAYWSLDPSGAEPLAPYEAMRLGFPTVALHTRVRGDSWDASVYAGIRQFHKAKGFDPESQEVARYLGHPYYQLASERDALAFAHVSEHDWYSIYADNESDYTETSASDWGDEVQVNHQRNHWTYQEQIPPVNEEDSDLWDTDDESEYPQTSSSEDAIDEEDYWSDEDDQDSRLFQDESNEMKSFATADDELLAPGGDKDPEPLQNLRDDEMLPVSRIFRFVMNVQLALIVFLSWSWLCDHLIIWK
ncbi:hypothetical protein MVEN_00856100 [Mycena venus]|uniref:Uncharacterized protein n=1 Tax=Mycena venus TaxID=2733690 RepID=A0A8H6YBN5_9AGAR|nr:hypothetical protein MVEN_00856100 [Mycena venus]